MDIVEERVKKKRKKKLFCYCGKEDDKTEMMVECTGKQPSCKNGWYHVTCLERREGRTLPRTKRGGVDGDVCCELCRTEKALGKRKVKKKGN